MGTERWTEVAQDIIVLPFWSEYECNFLIKWANKAGGFKPLPQDVKTGSAPGQELRLNHVNDGMYVDQYKKEVVERLFPIIRKFWHPVSPVNLRMPFIIKYTMDTQREMSPHHDSALVSLVIKLNDNYEGGVLSFPRQSWDTGGLNVGDVVLFPSAVTHVHQVKPITSGERYSFTGWITGKNSDYGDEI